MRKFVRNISQNVEILSSKRFESHSQGANGLKRLSESKMTNMDPVMEPILMKMIPCPGVGILKMIPCSAARPRTEKYMSTPPPPGFDSADRLFQNVAVRDPFSKSDCKQNSVPFVFV